MSNGVPEKTGSQTKWAVSVWKEWAVSKNLRMLHGEKPFSSDIERLSDKEIDFWLRRFILEIHQKDGKNYPPNSLYQILWTPAPFA